MVKRLLFIVDDDGLFLRSLARACQRPELEIVTFLGPALALAAAAVRPPDIIITDQRMPGMTGVELIERIRLLHPPVRAGILSAVPELAQFVQRGACDFILSKPWTAEGLRSALAFPTPASREPGTP